MLTFLEILKINLKSWLKVFHTFDQIKPWFNQIAWILDIKVHFPCLDAPGKSKRCSKKCSALWKSKRCSKKYNAPWEIASFSKKYYFNGIKFCRDKISRFSLSAKFKYFVEIKFCGWSIVIISCGFNKTFDTWDNIWCFEGLNFTYFRGFAKNPWNPRNLIPGKFNPIKIMPQENKHVF